MSYPIQEILKQFYPKYKLAYPSYSDTRKVALSILNCKTSVMGGNHAVCQDCGSSHTYYNSCRNRHCPCCQALNKEKWIDARKADVVDVPYFHAVFTVPHELNNLIFSNKRAFYNLLYQSSAETLKQLAQDERHLGAQIGFISILHTWGSNLSFHPHIHAIVLGGGLSKEETFCSSRSNFLFPVEVVSKLFKKKFLHGLNLLYKHGQLEIPFSEVMLRYRREFNNFYSILNQKKWNINIKETFKGAQNVINYLGRYTHNIAIANSRIIKYCADSVTFKIKDYKSEKLSTLTLTSVEFIRRFLMHVLPDRFVRIRHYGLLSNRSKRKKMALVRTLVGSTSFKPKFKDMTTLEILKTLYNFDPKLCKKCGGANIKNTTLISIPKLE